MESIIAFDRELFLFLNGLGNNRFDQFWLIMTHRGSNLLVYISIILKDKIDQFLKQNYNSLSSIEETIIGMNKIFIDETQNAK